LALMGGRWVNKYLSGLGSRHGSKQSVIGGVIDSGSTGYNARFPKIHTLRGVQTTPVKFSVTPHKDPRHQSAAPKYYATAKSTGHANSNEVAKMIARISTISTAYTMAMLEAFLTVVPDLLTEGKIVELGEFGTCRIGISSDGAAKADEVSADSIIDAHVIHAGAALQGRTGNLEISKRGRGINGQTALLRPALQLKQSSCRVI
jgi:predicted histone-like DNA-binding protein